MSKLLTAGGTEMYFLKRETHCGQDPHFCTYVYFILFHCLHLISLILLKSGFVLTVLKYVIFFQYVYIKIYVKGFVQNFSTSGFFSPVQSTVCSVSSVLFRNILLRKFDIYFLTKKNVTLYIKPNVLNSCTWNRIDTQMYHCPWMYFYAQGLNNKMMNTHQCRSALQTNGSNDGILFSLLSSHVSSKRRTIGVCGPPPNSLLQIFGHFCRVQTFRHFRITIKLNEIIQLYRRLPGVLSVYVETDLKTAQDLLLETHEWKQWAEEPSSCFGPSGVHFWNYTWRSVRVWPRFKQEIRGLLPGKLWRLFNSILT